MSQMIRGLLLLTCVLILGMLVMLLAYWRTPEARHEGSNVGAVLSGNDPVAGSDVATNVRRRAKPAGVEVIAEDLVQQKISLEITNISLREVLNLVHDQCGIDITFDRAALGNQTALLDQDVTLTAHEVPLSTVLDRLLLPCKLDWLTDREVLRITTQAAADQHLEVRVYDVLDLIQSGFEEETIVEIVEGCVEPETWASLKIGELLISGGPGSKSKAAPAEGDQNKVIEKELRGAAASPGVAKGRGRTRLHEGILIVWQTQRVHNQIEQLLEQIQALLDDMEDDRRFEPQIVTVKRNRSSRPRGNQRSLPLHTIQQ